MTWQHAESSQTFFQFFPSCCPRGATRRSTGRRTLSILSQLLLILESAARILARHHFQFFPSCCSRWPSRGRGGGGVLSILSQLLHSGTRVSWGPPAPFQFFPSCCDRPRSRGRSRGGRLSILSQLLRAPPLPLRPGPFSLSILSQLLPSVVRAWTKSSAPRLSILSQLLPWAAVKLLSLRMKYTFNSFPVAAPEKDFTETFDKDTFNSFPVAAEALAACTLINLSSTNFEVSENSPALPPDACSGSREAFPDSRRKEGIWRERNVV